jgi:hypothetical protein
MINSRFLGIGVKGFEPPASIEGRTLLWDSPGGFRISCPSNDCHGNDCRGGHSPGHDAKPLILLGLSHQLYVPGAQSVQREPEAGPGLRGQGVTNGQNQLRIA